MILGIDTSGYLEELAHGAGYYDGGRRIDPLDDFRANGVEYMRIRLWNRPFSELGEPYLGGGCDMENYIRLARLAKEKGFRLLLDFHYSDFWADPNKQFPPKDWQGLGLEELASAVYAFTRDCLRKANAAGVAPDMIQPGNEITNGMLWPLGKLETGPEGKRNYSRFCRLLEAACRACREELPEAEIVLHLERSNDCAVYQEFFAEMESRGLDYDVIGASYYPYWHGSPEELFANLRACRVFGKKLMVMELGYGFTDRPYVLGGETQRLVIDSERTCVPGFAERYPMSPEGQACFVRDLLAMARSEGLDGVFYWEPLWLPGEGICWASRAGQEYIDEAGKSTANEWANQCLFDYGGNKLPAFDAFS